MYVYVLLLVFYLSILVDAIQTDLGKNGGQDEKARLAHVLADRLGQTREGIESNALYTFRNLHRVTGVGGGGGRKEEKRGQRHSANHSVSTSADLIANIN